MTMEVGAWPGLGQGGEERGIACRSSPKRARRRPVLARDRRRLQGDARAPAKAEAGGSIAMAKMLKEREEVWMCYRLWWLAWQGWGPD